MKLFDPKLELRTIAAITNFPTGNAAIYLLSQLTPNHFHFEASKQAYKRIIKRMQTKGEIPSYSELESDPIINEDIRELIAANEYKDGIIKSKKRAANTFSLLDDFRKARQAYNIAKETIETLKGDSVDIDKLLTDMADGLTVARAVVASENELIHFGDGNNSASVVKDVLHGKDQPTIPTGFKTFDDKNGGFFKPAVAILSSNSSGGKSVAALQMAINMYRSGQSTLVLSLEMDKRQYTARFLSNISGVEATKIFLRTLTKQEERKIKDAYREFVEFGKRNKVRWTILSPDAGMTLDQLLMIAKPYGYDIVTVDYISLLEEADTDNQARALASITRKAKIFSQAAKCLIILLAQLNEEGLIKYSRAIKENADHVWTWVFSDTERETHLITMKVDKGRNQMCFPFEVVENYSTMSLIDNGPVKDFNDNQDDSNTSETKDRKGKKKMKSSKKSNKSDKDDTGYLEEDDI